MLPHVSHVFCEAHATPAVRYKCKHLMGAYAMYAPIEHLSYSMSIQMVKVDRYWDDYL